MGGVAAGEFGGMNLGGGGGGFAPVIEPPVPEVVPPVLPPNISPQEFELAQMLQRGQEHQSILPPPPERGIPVNQGRGTPDNPLAFLDKDPRVTQRFDGERGGFGRPPGDVILHDRAGSTPQDGPRYGVPGTGDTYPYHVEVQPDGSIKQFHQGTSVAPHAAGMSPYSLGVAYGGPYGATPTPQAMRSLQDVYSGLKQSNPDLQFRSHGQAFADTANNEFRASRSGRDMAEASWRNNLNDVPLQAAPNGPFEQFAYASPEKAFGSPGSQSVTGVSSRSVGPPPTQFAQAPAAAAPPLAARGIMTAAGYGNMAPQTPPLPTIPTPPPQVAASPPMGQMGLADAGDAMRGREAPTGQSVANAMNTDYSPPSRVANFAPPMKMEPPGVSRFAQAGIAGAGYPMVADGGMRNAPPTLAATLQAQQPPSASPPQTMPSQVPADGPRRLADAGDPLRRQPAEANTMFAGMKPLDWKAAGKMMQALGGKYASAQAGGIQMADIAPQTPARTPQPSQGSGRMRRFKSAFPVEPTQT